MGASKFGATRLFLWREFHEFDAGVVGVVEIELPFAIAAQLGLFSGLPAILDELLFGGVNIRYPKRDVVHYTERMFVSIGRDVEHVLDPVRAVRHLHGDPIVFVVLHSSMPIGTESQDVFVEMVFGGAVTDYETSVDDG